MPAAAALTITGGLVLDLRRVVDPMIVVGVVVGRVVSAVPARSSSGAGTASVIVGVVPDRVVGTPASADVTDGVISAATLANVVRRIIGAPTRKGSVGRHKHQTCHHRRRKQNCTKEHEYLLCSH